MLNSSKIINVEYGDIKKFSFVMARQIVEKSIKVSSVYPINLESFTFAAALSRCLKVPIVFNRRKDSLSAYIVQTGPIVSMDKSHAVLLVTDKDKINVPNLFYGLDYSTINNPKFVFPWSEVFSPEKKISDIISYIGDDPTRSGLVETPRRVVNSWKELYSGYGIDPVSVVKLFDIDTNMDEIIAIKNIEFYSTCEHHMLPFYGKISVGYVPNKKIIGISKIPRLIEIYARRLQIQENLTSQIANILFDMLKPKGVMVVCHGKHLCMVQRGVKKQDGWMVTSAVLGIFKTNPPIRAEFMEIIK